MITIRGGRRWTAADLPRRAVAVRQHPPLFNALTADATQLGALLSQGKLSSVDIVQEYIWRVQEYNEWLNAIWELCPTCIEQAERADEVRKKQPSSCGPLAGIPVWIKDSIATDPRLGMGTTAGAISLLGSRPNENSPLVQKLIDAGAIIIGKTTLSELAFHRGFGIPCGWSATAGQANSPYVKGGIDLSDKSVVGHSSPGGSSSGSAIAVAAGLGPLAIGTETEGSLIVPATRASLYSIKPSVGLISTKGIIPISSYMDTAGPMTRSVSDLANLLAVMVDSSSAHADGSRYLNAVTTSWDGLRIGLVNPQVWQYPAAVVQPNESITDEIFAATREAYSHIEKHATAIATDVSLRPHTDFEVEGKPVFGFLMDATFEKEINEYLGALSVVRVRTLQEMVDYNTQFAGYALQEYDDQGHLLNGLKFDRHDEVEGWLEHGRTVGQSLSDTLDKYNIDVIVGPGDCFLTNYAAAVGGPIGAVPIGYSEVNGRPFGLQVLARRHREDLVIRFMSAWESSWGKHEAPREFDKHIHKDNV